MESEPKQPMNWTLEVIVVPVTDLDRAKKFYAEQLGFNVDFDTRNADGQGLLQLTPRGSGCSITIGTGLVESTPGSLKGLQLVVNDLRRARQELAGNGVDVSEVRVFDGGFRPATDDDDLNNVGFAFFDDPDGNSWAVQQITSRP